MIRNRSGKNSPPSSSHGEGEEAHIQGTTEESIWFRVKMAICPFMPLVSVVVVFAVFVYSVHAEMLDLCNISGTCTSPAEKVLNSFCSGSVSKGDEGAFDSSETFRLQHVVMNIRHGDRSTLFHIPGLIKHSDPGNNGINSKDLKYMKNLSAFQLQALEDYDHFFLDPLNVERLDDLAQKPMEQGKLTVSGFNQHIALGKHLKKAYFNFLQQIKSPDQIFIRSTYFERTIQSAAALMIGMVPRFTRPGRPKDLMIYYHPYKRDEAMHGVGIRRKSGLNLCPRAVGARQAQYMSNETYDILVSDHDAIVKTFGSDDIQGQRIVDMIDVMLPGYCQGGHLPCVQGEVQDDESSGQRCLTLEQLVDMKIRGDEDFCHTFGGSAGGELSSRLAMYPFLMQVKRALFHAADLDVDIPNDNFVNNMGKIEPKLGVDRSFGSKLEAEMLKRRQTPREQRSSDQDIRFTLYSGHDTVIAPVLAALGVYNKFCTWPPYASHIVFELWKNARSASLTRAANDTMRDYYVRALYNGKDFTRHIPECRLATERVRVEDANARFRRPSRRLDELGPATHYSLNDPPPKYRISGFEKMYDGQHLCSLEAFARQIDGLIGTASSMTEACQTTR